LANARVRASAAMRHDELIGMDNVTAATPNRENRNLA
jgi:hypothetical protein